MRRADLESLSVRIALAVGFVGTLGLWLYTNYAFTQRIETVQRDAAAVAARYTNAQELLATVRAQVLVSSVRVRDALLDPTPAALQQCREQLEKSSRITTTTLEGYVPVLTTAADGVAIGRLANEIDQFHQRSMQVLADAAGMTPTQVRDVLSRRIGPHREAALAISEEIQTINRRGFIREQSEVAEIQRVAEAQSRDRVGIAFVIGFVTLLLTSAYAGRLEARLRAQLVRDARISSELQQTAAKVLNAQEEERRTIARELHDEVGQALTAIRVELDVAGRTIEMAGGSAEPLGEAQAITDGALHTVRNLTQLLHPAALDDLGLPAVIDSALRGLQRRYNIRGNLEQIDLPPRLPRDVELAAYRIVQEGITNVAKHARATRCDVRLTQLDDRLLVEVEDDGIGFVEDTDRPIVARGMGLVSIRERASRLGGTFNILSRPGAGTRLIVSLPEKNVA
ncbi:MAG TPA: sensor histidine kinase [Vicinamibacterales bacterium]|jgi:signal transduction histidine kinase|nr:sensor histidine kinase [Vicinamibacterales bacterium]